MEEMKQQVEYFKSVGQADRGSANAERTNFDVEMMKETRISVPESRTIPDIITGLAPGQPPYTLMDYFGDDFYLL